MSATKSATTLREIRQRQTESDPALASRVAHGVASPADVQTYRQAQVERDREQREYRASRMEEYSELTEAQRKGKYRDLSREFEEVSDQMRALSPATPLWDELREQKKDLAYEIEDLKAADDLAAYNNVQKDRQRRSDERKQLDVAKNAPFNREPAPVVKGVSRSGEGGSDASGLPGADDPPEGEQDATIDSIGVLKRGIPHVAPDGSVKELPAPHSVEDYDKSGAASTNVSAQQAVQRQ